MSLLHLRHTPQRHVIRVIDDYSHHRETYIETGDTNAFRKMLESIRLEDTREDES
jgi:hypothetical protein